MAGLPIPVEGIEPSLSHALLALWLVVAAASWLLLRCPWLLHQPKRRKGDPRFSAQFIAHRGCRMDGLPENTVAAMRHALACEAGVLEFDVWLTRDGQVVVFHDADLGRMCGGKGQGKCIPACDYAELPRIDLEGNRALWSAVTEENIAEAGRIPLLEEVLGAVPVDKPMIIEFKQKDEALIRKVHELVTAQGRKGRITWFSLSEEINLALRAFDPEIPTIASVPTMLKYILLYYAGVLPFVPIPEDMFGIPVDEVDYNRVREQKAFKSFPDGVCRVLAYVLGGKPPRALIPPGLFAHLRARGIPVLFLGVNDDADIRVAEQAGATAVLTDRPSWLRDRIRQGQLGLKKLDL